MLNQELTISNERKPPEEGDFDLGVSTNLTTSPCTLKGILPALLVLQNGAIKKIETIENEGLRFHIRFNGDQILPQQIQNLRRLLEKVITSPINVLWTSTYIEFIPL
ncbi:MAG: hypothetical protein ACFFDT_23710 [Candidatus Hodarchaeota archaeon]